MSRSSLALSNLRGIVIVLVLAFHSALAYLAFAPAQKTGFAQPPYSWQAFPIVDTHHWLGFDIFCAWEDVFMMALMFFLSGLLAAGSLQRRGPLSYAVGRLTRIGLPFVLAMMFLSLPSFYPAYLARTTDPSLAGYWRDWLSLPFWPSGPEWFLWQLLALNMLAALIFAVWPGVIERFNAVATEAARRPLRYFLYFAAAAILAYAPLALAFTPWNWKAIGPFSLQLCRPALYLLFFFAGAALGSRGLDRGLLAEDGPLAQNWWRLLAAAAAGFFVWAGFTSLTMPDWNTAPLVWRCAASIAYPLGCVSCSLSLVALCLRFASGVRLAALDSLSANAYSIYLVHYVFVVWLQYALLRSGLIAAAKLGIVLTGALAMSWGVSIAFGRVLASSQAGAARRTIAPAPR